MQTDAHPLLLISQRAKTLKVQAHMLCLSEHHGLIVPARTKAHHPY